MNFSWSRAGGVANIFSAMIILLTAFGLKLFYSSAGAEELNWILGPTAWVVELLGESDFVLVPAKGYVRTDGAFVIAPACAGVNFLIIAFCITGFFILHQYKRFSHKLVSLVVCLAGSFLLTLLVNGVRIEISMVLFSSGIEWGWLNLERVHRLAGICIYLFSLVCVYSIMEKILFRRPGRDFLPSSPFSWYPLIAVGIPLLNRGWQKGTAGFLEHCLTVICVSLVVFGFCYLVKSIRLLRDA